MGERAAPARLLPLIWRPPAMSIVRVGMSENKSYGDGYDAIFGKSGTAKKPAATAKKPPAKKAAPAAKKPAKKKK